MYVPASGVASANSRFPFDLRRWGRFARRNVKRTQQRGARRNGCFRRVLAEAPEFVWMKRWYWVLSPKTEYVFSQRRHFKAIKARLNRIWFFFFIAINCFSWWKWSKTFSNGWCLKQNSFLVTKRYTTGVLCNTENIPNIPNWRL